MKDYTVTISGEEREDGEKPYTYVVSACSPAEAAEQALIGHGPAFGLTLEGIVPGVPPDECGYHWNDLRNRAEGEGSDLLAALKLAVEGLDFAQAQVESKRDHEKLVSYWSLAKHAVDKAEGRTE
jgi:hypothetical protein